MSSFLMWSLLVVISVFSPFSSQLCRIDTTPWAKTINVFRACLGAQKWRNFVLFSTVSLRFVLSRVCVFLYSLGPLLYVIVLSTQIFSNQFAGVATFEQFQAALYSNDWYTKWLIGLWNATHNTVNKSILHQKHQEPKLSGMLKQWD